MELNAETISVNGIEYVKKDTVNNTITGNVKIVILQRGWVMVGYFDRKDNTCTLTKANVIRSWGTTKGLGELAANGPTKDTKLDKTNGLVEFDYLTVVASISCAEVKWKTVL